MCRVPDEYEVFVKEALGKACKLICAPIESAGFDKAFGKQFRIPIEGKALDKV